MNDNYKNRMLVAGLVLILLSLTLLLYKVENSSKRAMRDNLKIYEAGEKKELLNMEISREKKEIDRVNEDVDKLNSGMNRVMDEALEINRQIVHHMNNGVANSQTLDSIQILEGEMSQKEEQIDSLSREFEERSNMLLDIMDKYSRDRSKLDSKAYEADYYRKRVLIDKISFLLYSFFFLISLVSGTIFLARGLRS